MIIILYIIFKMDIIANINTKCIIAACTNNVYITRNTGKMKINYCYDHMGNIENYYC
jgi:hypothetical protein